MKISQIQDINGISSLLIVDKELIINSIYSSDLLSDILTNGNNSSVLITIQNHINTIAVAAQCNIKSIIFCSNREISKEMITLASTNDISLFITDKNQYQTSIAIYSNIL